MEILENLISFKAKNTQVAFFTIFVIHTVYVQKGEWLNNFMDRTRTYIE